MLAWVFRKNIGEITDELLKPSVLCFLTESVNDCLKISVLESKFCLNVMIYF